MRQAVILLFLLSPAFLMAQVVLTGADGVVLANTEGSILTSGCGSYIVDDVDGNTNNTVGIGTQCWLGKNLKTTRYRNGDLIGTTTPATLDISAETSPKYQWAYGGDEANVAVRGRLYTWFAVMDSRNICPTGWHVPIDGEWTILVDYLGGASAAGGKLKQTGTAYWLPPNTAATNSTGFSAVPVGDRFPNGTFGYLNEFGTFQSSS
jgi:uncharacterized protein (TIGR02145 family)